MTIKYLNQQNVKALLKLDPGVKTISAEAVQWIDDVVEQVAKNLAASGRKSPSGRLMGPKMDPELTERTIVARQEAQMFLARAQMQAYPCAGPAWTEYNDWQQERRTGKTKLPFEEWKEQQR